MSNWLSRITRILFLAVLLVSLLPAQTAQVTGRIADATGAVVPGAKVVIKNVETGVEHDTVANDSGYYTVPLLPPGRYSISVQKEGFRPVMQTGVELQVAQQAGIDFTLEVGQINQQVSIEASAPLLQTEDASVGQVIDTKRIEELPLNGRDYIQLALLSSGTANPVSGSRAGGFSSGGQRLSANNYLLDGADNNSIELADAGRSAELVKPSVDAIQEFKVQTNAYSAEYGHGTGAVINVTIKSGTNGLHGTVFEFLRNEAFDAKNLFQAPNTPIPPYKRNQYGASVGGPIIKNHTFFFGDFEKSRLRQSSTTVSALPTAAQRAGNFAALTSKTLVDPLTNLPFAGNVIPASRIDPVAATLVGLYPATQANVIGSNYTFNSPNNEDDLRWDVRVDHTFSERDNIFGRVSHYERNLPAVLALPAPAYGNAGTPYDSTIYAWNDALGWNHIFTPSLIASTRIAWNYSEFKRVNPAVAGTTNLNAQYGLKGVDLTDPGDFSDFSITGYRGLGIGQNNPVARNSQNRQFVNDWNWNHGKQDIKFGVNIIRAQNNILNSRDVVGSFTFNGQFTGDGLADFLLGWPSAFSISSPVDVNLRGWLLAGYIQDDWKLTPRLTVNLGVRYEISRPFIDTQNRMSNFDQDTNPAQPVLVLAGGSYDGRSLVNTDLNGWEPRVGLAYQVSHRTVIRTGFGIFRTYFEPLGDSQFLIGNPPFAYSVTLSGTNGAVKAPTFQLSNGAPTNLLSINNANGLSFSSYERNPKRAYSPQWNFNIQQQLGGNWVLEVGYLGQRGVHLLNRIEGNFSPPGPGNLNAKRLIQSTVIPGTNIVASPLGTVLRHQWSGNSNYHALAAKLEKRYSYGLTVLNSFTWSKAIGDTCADSADGSSPNCGFQDPLNMRAEKSLDNQDQRFRFVNSTLYELPVGRGRRWGAKMPRAFDAVVGGWGLGTIFTAASGLPYTVVTSGNPANTGSTNVINRPNVVGDPNSGPNTVQQWFNTAAFVPNGLYQYGSVGRNTMTGPGFINLDCVALKTFTITERVRLQFRAEAFNATNTPPLGFPNATLGTSNFGAITSAGAPRQLQFGLKILF